MQPAVRVKSQYPTKFTVLKDAINYWCDQTNKSPDELSRLAGIPERSLTAFLGPRGSRLNATTYTKLTVILVPYYKEQLVVISKAVIITRQIAATQRRLAVYMHHFGYRESSYEEQTGF